MRNITERIKWTIKPWYNRWYKLLMIIPDDIFLKISFRINVGYKLNLKNPRSFNEKTQWLKLYDRNPRYTTLSDKYEVKKIVSDIIGEDHIIPTLGVWDKFDDIPLDSLPDSFVLKCTHDSGGIVICKDKADFDKKLAKKKIQVCLKRNFYEMWREWQYKDIKPRIIAEPYMKDDNSGDSSLKDYKFFCFNGKVKALFVATDRNVKGKETKFDFYDKDFNHLDFTNGHENAETIPAKPANLDEMIKYAEILSSGLPSVRMDFYDINGKVYFGEYTFCHWSGLKKFVPEKWDYIFGSWIELPSH